MSSEPGFSLVSRIDLRDPFTVAVVCDPEFMPRRATEGAAGLDLRAALVDSLTLLHGSRAIVPTGVRCAIPLGFEGQVRPRSSLSMKGVHMHVGTIDSDYRGEIGAIIHNLSGAPFTIARGDRIAQLVIAPVARMPVVMVEALDETARGSGGFGSTGR